MTKATYTTHPNAAYRGNPFIESLSLPLTQHQFLEQCSVPFACNLDLQSVPDELHGYYTRTAIDTLSHAYVVQDEAYRLYDNLRRMIEAGYVKRNPLNKDIRQLLTAIEKDKETPLQSNHIHALNLTDAKNCTFVAGLSGRGKTTMIKHLLKLIDQKIEHAEYATSDNEVIPLNQTQITYLYVEVHERRGQKAVLMNLLEAIDAATGENYQYRFRNYNVNNLILAVRKAVIIHGVGLIIVDEAQNLARASTSETLGNNERTSMKFFEELFNRIAVPLCFVGTFSMLKLFSKEMTISRRATANGSLMMASCNVNSSFWQRFTNTICQTNLLKNQKTDQETIRFHLHHLTAGIPAIAASLVKATLNYLTFLAPENQDLSTKALNLIFDQQFKILKPAILALRKGNYHKFEDFEPMLLLEQTGDEDELASLAAKVNKVEQNTLQGAVQFKNDTSTKDVSVDNLKLMDQMSPEELTASLGYSTDKSGDFNA